MTTVQQIQQWAMKDWTRFIRIAIAGSPWGTYKIIMANWPGQFRMIQQNYITDNVAKKDMQNFLEDKARQSGNPGLFLQRLLSSVPVEYPVAIDQLINTN